MNARCVARRGWRLVALCCTFSPGWTLAQGPTTPGDQPAAAPALSRPTPPPISRGPVHEALVSPSKDHEPVHVEKAPPARLNERPGDPPPSKTAVSLPGYWDWDPRAEDYVWVAGTWREPPPGRFWAHGYWRRDPGKGWYRVPGFWTDRPLGQIQWRKQGPPADRPEDEPGPPPGEGRFYIAGRYVPEGDGATWQKGYWTRNQPGWVWEPAQWVKQPEGWTYQEGYWDRPLEDRGVRYAQVKPVGPAREGDTVFQPGAPTNLGPPVQGYAPASLMTSSGGGYFRSGYEPAGRSATVTSSSNPSAYLGPMGGSVPSPTGYFQPNQPMVNNNNPGYVSGPSSATGIGGYPYYGYGVGYSPGYYGTSSFGSGVGYYSGYYGGSGFQAGQQGIQQGGLGGYPYYGHGLGYYPGYYGP